MTANAGSDVWSFRLSENPWGVMHRGASVVGLDRPLAPGEFDGKMWLGGISSVSQCVTLGRLVANDAAIGCVTGTGRCTEVVSSLD